MLYLSVCLSRSRLCQALGTPWAYACRSLGPLAYVVSFALLVACLSVTTCETHLRDVGVLDTHLSLLRAILLCLLCSTRLACLAFLHLCTLA